MNHSLVLIPFLNRLRRRLRLRDGLRLAQQTLWLAGLAALLVMLAGRIWPIERLWLWALIPLAAWLLVVMGYALFRPLPVMRVARRVDGELHLKERLSTSLALDAEQDSPVYAAFVPDLIDKAHTDAVHTARLIQPARDFPLRLL